MNDNRTIWNPTRRRTLWFSCCVLPAILVVAGGIAAIRSGSPRSAAAFWFASAAVAAVCAIIPQVGWLLYLAFHCVAYPIAKALSLLVSAIIFYAFLTPFAFILRLTGRDPLRLRRPSSVASLWTERSQPDSIERYFKQF